jgi:hypothetical protein
MPIIMILTLLLFMTPMTSVKAKETVSEKASKTSHDIKRAGKNGINRTQEAVCMKGDAKCLKQKAKHRAQELNDKTQDKAREIKNKID